jgi:hypothetical protein
LGNNVLMFIPMATKILEALAPFPEVSDVVVTPPEIQYWDDGDTGFTFVQDTVPKTGDGNVQFYRAANRSPFRRAVTYLENKYHLRRPELPEHEAVPVVAMFGAGGQGMFYDARGGQAKVYELETVPEGYRVTPGSKPYTGKDVPIGFTPGTQLLFGICRPLPTYARHHVSVEGLEPPAVATYKKMTEAVDRANAERRQSSWFARLVGRSAASI